MKTNTWLLKLGLGISYLCLFTLALCVAVSIHEEWWGYAAFGFIGGGFHFVNIGLIKNILNDIQKEKHEALKKIG